MEKAPQVGNILLQQAAETEKTTCNAIRYLWGNESRNDWILMEKWKMRLKGIEKTEYKKSP